MSHPETEKPDVYAPPAQAVFSQDVATEPPRLGPGQRLVGVLFSPGETFADINRKPTWITPLLITMVASVVFALFFNWWVNPDWDRITREMIRKQTERFGQSMPPEDQIQQQIAFTKTIQKFSPLIAPIIPLFVTFLLSGIYALGMMVMQAQTTFKRILSVVSWTNAAVGNAYAQGVVYLIISSASLMVRDPETIDPTQPGGLTATNFAAFLPADTSAPIASVVASIDILTIWTLILFTIGFAAIGGTKKFTTKKTGTLVFGLWLVWVLLKAAVSPFTGG